MKITPVDIAHKSFNKKMMGIDQDEVMDFLQMVAHQIETLIHERNSLREALREKEMHLLEYKERDQVLKSTISAASQMSEKIKNDAEREAKLIIADAQQKAELITRDSRDSLKRVYQEISDLKRMRVQFEANLKAMAQAHLSILDQGDRFMPQMSLPDLTMQESQSQTANNTRNTQISPLSVG